ncbi:hydroxyacylglutathione hydrolase [Gilvimarinus xylanilyticus]|uniref:Hydroxyacylglutathione hydrolase n=1 Tax=Gilvimarinus xylanilyticus TaxID=2944139 RepID=A0A9X2KS65_9GAMM|nr:hydroxyacylglutathione hydrolase [Gilvimarinus xylanilyticus]MCP8898526.1 hydroxyacylglutathione hydrolase [Gilvimarinus xylanilyticus]
MQLSLFPALQTNYFWLLQPDDSKSVAYIFDPGDATAVKQQLQARGLTLAGIVITHHHWDHTDGIDELVADCKVPVYGPRSDKIPQVDHVLSEGDKLTLGPLTLDVLETPGHTLDHISYLLQTPEQDLLFCADTLFAGGCGRMFEGSPEQFLSSLNRLKALPERTQVCCSHEYTVDNLRFAQAAEPDNRAIAERLARETEKRRQGQSTLPSTIGLEKQTNPFLRTDSPSLKASVKKHTGLKAPREHEVFAALRQWKDRFKAN